MYIASYTCVLHECGFVLKGMHGGKGYWLLSYIDLYTVYFIVNVVGKKFVIGVCVIHWKGCGYLHFVIGLLIICLLSYQCLLTDTKLSSKKTHTLHKDKFVKTKI